MIIVLLENLVPYNDCTEEGERDQQGTAKKDQYGGPVQFEHVLAEHAVVVVVVLVGDPAVPTPGVLAAGTLHFGAAAVPRDPVLAVRAELHVVAHRPLLEVLVGLVDALLALVPGLSAEKAEVQGAVVAGELFVLEATDAVTLAALARAPSQIDILLQQAELLVGLVFGESRFAGVFTDKGIFEDCGAVGVGAVDLQDLAVEDLVF